MKHHWRARTGVALGVVLFMACASLAIGAEAPPLDGTAWVLASLPGEARLAGLPATARFEAGRVQGSDGCNRYSAPYSIKGSTLEISGRTSTLMACSPETMTQAGTFTASLRKAKGYRLRHGQLQLLGVDGSVLCTFTAQPTEFARTQWRATGINNGKGGVASLVGDSTVTMAFGNSGSVVGFAGCNAWRSFYRTQGDQLHFVHPRAVSPKVCAAASVMEQEQAFFTALESVATVRWEGDRLEMRTAEDALALSLQRVTRP